MLKYTRYKKELEMVNTSLLKEQDIWGQDSLKIFDKTKDGRRAKPTDFARIMGVSSEDTQYCGWWTDSQTDDDFAELKNGKAQHVRCVNENGDKSWSIASGRFDGVRLAARLSELQHISPSEQVEEVGDIKIIKSLAYPQKIVPSKLASNLDTLLQYGDLTLISTVTIDSMPWQAVDKSFKAQVLPVYEHERNLYTKCEVYSGSTAEITMSDGQNGEESYWFQVEPLNWLIDDSGIAITEKVIFAGVQMSKSKNYDGDFQNSEMNIFLQNCFIKDAISLERALQEIKEV
jgi:hypothetical protein